MLEAFERKGWGEPFAAVDAVAASSEGSPFSSSSSSALGRAVTGMVSRFASKLKVGGGNGNGNGNRASSLFHPRPRSAQPPESPHRHHLHAAPLSAGAADAVVAAANDIALQAAWCRRYARVNTVGLRKIVKKYGKLCGDPRSADLLQTFWSGERAAMAGFLTSPLLTELRAAQSLLSFAVASARRRERQQEQEQQQQQGPQRRHPQFPRGTASARGSASSRGSGGKRPLPPPLPLWA